MAKTSSARLNAEDFARLPNDGFRYEIIAGELYMSPSPKARHQYLLGELYYRLRAYLAAHPLGRAYVAPFDVHFGGEDIVQPDLIFIRQERVKALVKDWIYGVPDLLVEVLSPATDRGGRAFCSGSKAGAERPRNSAVRPAPGKRSGAAPSGALAGPGRTGVPGPAGAQAGRAADPGPPTRSGARWGGQPRWGPRQAMTRLDRQAKYHLYETRGVADYWLADPERRRWEAYRLRAGKYQQVANLGGSDVFTTSVFPGWELPLASLWMPDPDEPGRGPAATG